MPQKGFHQSYPPLTLCHWRIADPCAGLICDEAAHCVHGPCLSRLLDGLHYSLLLSTVTKTVVTETEKPMIASA